MLRNVALDSPESDPSDNGAGDIGASRADASCIGTASLRGRLCLKQRSMASPKQLDISRKAALVLLSFEASRHEVDIAVERLAFDQNFMHDTISCTPRMTSREEPSQRMYSRADHQIRCHKLLEAACYVLRLRWYVA